MSVSRRQFLLATSGATAGFILPSYHEEIERQLDLKVLSEFYDEVEIAIVCDWLGAKRPHPLRDIDIAEPPGETMVSGAVRLVESKMGTNDFVISNAVARLVLSSIQERLPQWGASRGDGQISFGRAYVPARDGRVELLPRFLFEINWADSGPGFSWPESYHATYLPGFNLYVVTASQDSPEVHGYTDEAIGHFSADESILSGSHRVIVNWWKAQAEGWDQERWAYLFDTGQVDEATADEWAQEVWGYEPAEVVT